MPDIRLYVPQDFRAGSDIALCREHAHYLMTVMRLKPGQRISVFNGREGEWRAQIVAADKKSLVIGIEEQVSPQRNSPDLWLAFAPIKNKSELVVEKATELGVSKLLPVITQHAMVKSVNEEKLKIHAIEAAEQCERHDVPVIECHKDLAALIAAWPQNRILFYGDESGGGQPLRILLNASHSGLYGVLIGPEGGFSKDEQRLLRSASFIKPFGMGPRILRADTAAVAALACLQAWLGDWEQSPHFKAG